MTAGPTSARDPRIVRAARLLRDADARRKEGAFVVDGEELVREARTAGLVVEEVFEAATSSPDAMRALSLVGDPPDVVAVVRIPPPPPPGLPPSSLVLAGVADAGNVGSIIRTARAFGLPRVALTPGCGDPWSRRALRAAQGASFAPGLVATGRPLAEFAVRDERPPLAAAVPRGGVDPDALPPGAAVVLGSERDGLAPGERAVCDLTVTVPAAGFESLNVAAAAAVLAYAIAGRARRTER
jgi:TrmH family RNA methyltransferase